MKMFGKATTMIKISTWKKFTFLTPLSTTSVIVGLLTLTQSTVQGATVEAIAECMKKLMYQPVGRVCYMNGMKTDPIHCQYGAGKYAEWRDVIERSEISEDAAAKACQNASTNGATSREQRNQAHPENVGVSGWQNQMQQNQMQQIQQMNERYRQEEKERYRENAGSQATDAF